MYEIKRGDIFWIRNSEYRPQTVGSVQKPGRPGIIVSNDLNNAHSTTLEVVYLTRAPKKRLPIHCVVESYGEDSTVLCEQVTTISTDQLGDYIKHCTEEEMRDVDRCIMASLGLTDPEPRPEKEAQPELSVEALQKAYHRARSERDLLMELYRELLDRIKK